MSTTPEPFRYVDADQFCLSARLLPGLDAGALSISVEGDGEPQSVHVPVADMPQILSGLAAASGVQPDTRPEAYGDGKGRAYCLRCAHHVGASVPLTANDVDAHELCPSCGRHVVDVAQETEPARPVPDTERRERYARAFFALTGLSERRTWESLSPLLRKVHYERADAALAVADEEQRDLRREAEYFQGWADSNGRNLNTALAENAHLRRADKAATKEITRLRAELEKARATTPALTEAERDMLNHALNQVQLRIWAPGSAFSGADQAVADSLRRMAAARSGGQAEAYPAERSWRVETYDDTAEYWAPGTLHADRATVVDRLTFLRTTRPTWAVDGKPVERRLVRATTTYTVEQAEDGAQQK